MNAYRAFELGKRLLPNPNGLENLPTDPYILSAFNLSASKRLVHAVLGENHPLMKVVDGAKERTQTFVPALYRMAEDTLKRWDLGLPLCAEDIALASIRHMYTVTDRWCLILNVLSSLENPTDDTSDELFIPFTYQVSGQTRQFSLHRSLGYHQFKSDHFGDKPAPAVHICDLDTAAILLNPKPDEYLQQLADLGVFEYFRGILDGEFYAPIHIREYLPHLGYILFHQLGDCGMQVAFHPNRGDNNQDPLGICLPTASDTPWILGKTPHPSFSGYRYLAFPHETQHAYDDDQFWFNGVGELVITELRAFLSEVETAGFMGWNQDKHTIRLQEKLIPLHTGILQGQVAMTHADRHCIEQTQHLLFDIRDRQDSALIFDAIEQYLESHAHPSD